MYDSPATFQLLKGRIGYMSHILFSCLVLFTCNHHRRVLQWSSYAFTLQYF